MAPSSEDFKIVSGETFKKKQGSNPQQVRQQFLRHAMGAGAHKEPGEQGRELKAKLRPFREILNKLRYDAAYNVEDYVVGYIDRKAGILEVSVSAWNGGKRGEDVVAYVKGVRPIERIVWDRARRIDLLS